MGRKTKAVLEAEARDKELDLLQGLLSRYRSGPYSDSEEFIDAIGYMTCSMCSSVAFDMAICQICDDNFCENCSDEHAVEETGL